jgi:hypothetical protein
MRPDRLGSMFDAYHEEKLVIVTVTRGDWKEGSTSKLIQKISQDGYVVWVMDGRDRHLLLPEGVTKEEGISRAEKAWRRLNGRT